MTIGQRIADLRKAKGMTQEELAHKVGYKEKSSINKIELGVNDVRQKMIVKFAEALGVSPAYLLGEDETPEICITDEEADLINLWKTVPDTMKPVLLAAIKAAGGNQ